MRGGVNHIDLTVSDLARSAPFYESVLGYLGYRRTNERPGGVDFDHETADGFCSIGLVEARTRARHDRYAPGLHHLALGAASRADVDAFHAHLLATGATILDAPADYPEYGSGYYAVFFADPDGLKLEFVHWPRPAAG